MHFLSGDDFQVVEGPSGKPLMVNGLRGLSMVMFYSNNCEHCQTMMPIFKQLPSLVKGAQFAIANVSTHKAIIAKSRGTNTQIDYVPLVIFYVDGMPFAQYTGNHDIKEVIAFIQEMAQRAQKKQQFAAPARPGTTPVGQGVPSIPPQQQQQMRMASQQPNLPQPTPSAMTRPGNRQQPMMSGDGAGPSMQQQAPPAPIDEENRPYKPSAVCYMSFDEVYGQ